MANSKRTCTHKPCRASYRPAEGIIHPSGKFGWCGEECRIKWAAANAPKFKQKADRDFKAETRRRKTKLNEESLPWQIKETQKRFNLFIRLRDKDLPCITSGKTDAELTEIFGGKWDCGHFLTVGAHPHLRFWPANAHKQSKKDNGGAGNYTAKEHTTQTIYRENILRRISAETLAIIEGPHAARKYTCPELSEMRQIINAEIRFMQANGKPSRDWYGPGDVLQIAKAPV